MNKFATMLCIAGTALALSACESSQMGNVETDVPYTQNRTATYTSTATAQQPVQSEPVRTERVFKRVQAK